MTTGGSSPGTSSVNRFRSEALDPQPVAGPSQVPQHDAGRIHDQVDTTAELPVRPFERWTLRDELSDGVEQPDRRTGRSRLHTQAAIEDMDFRAARGIDRALLVRLASCAWVQSNDTVLISGATGTGKTYLACALGHSACRYGFSTRYYRFSRLLGELALARADWSYPKLLERLARTQLLILDDFGLAPLVDTERRDLLEVLEDRYGRRATLITSQLPLDHWHGVVGDTTFADAILDRLVHHAHRITLKGGSMRKKAAGESGSRK